MDGNKWILQSTFRSISFGVQANQFKMKGNG